MILLDTNYLIRVLIRDSEESARVKAWISTGVELITSSVAWYEFLCGPVDADGIDTVAAILNDRIIPYTADHACESARLWNGIGRKRSLRIDAMIAATAIITNADLATENKDDFMIFSAYGLRVIG